MDPTSYKLRETFDYLEPEQHFVYISHVNHVNHTAQVGTTTLPPSVMGIDHQVVMHIHTLDSP